MSRNQRIRVKLILILLGVILLAFIAVINIRKISQKQGEYIPFYRVLLLLETVEPSLKENVEFKELEKESQNMKIPEYMTYRQYLAVCKLV